MNKDLHLELLLNMNLEDIRHFCQLSSYYTSLCHTPILINKLNQAKQKVNTIMKLLGNRIRLITNQNFSVFYNLMHRINIKTPNYNIDFFVDYIDMDRFALNVYLFYNYGKWDYLRFEIDEHEYRKLEEFLLHGFYNNYIIDYELNSSDSEDENTD